MKLKRPGYFWSSCIAIVYSILFFAILLFKKSADPGSDVVFSSFMAGAIALAMLMGLSAFLSLSKQRSSYKWISLLISLGLVSILIGQIISTLNIAFFPTTTPYPSLADVFYLSYYPLYLWGVLLLPTRRVAAETQLELAADGVMMMLSAVIFSWFFILGPILLQSQNTILAQLTSAAYPTGDLVLVSCLILLFLKQNSIHPKLRFPLLFLVIGLLLMFSTDSIDTYFALTGRSMVVFEFSTWAGGYFCIGISLQLFSFYARQLSTITFGEAPSWKRSFLPYAFVTAVLPLVFAIWKSGDTGLIQTSTSLASTALIGLVLLRQILVLRAIHEANNQLNAMATTDPLTGLPNHRNLATLLEQELIRAQMYNRPYCLLFFDIDHFKALNDGYGHAAGDIVLHEFASVIRSSLRPLDTVGRWGGEEFVSLIPELGVEEGLQLAETVRIAVASQDFHIGGGSHITCSIGLACYPVHGQTREALLEAADHAMYGAKRLGRNQVRVANDPAVLALLSSLKGNKRDQISLQGTVEALMELGEARDFSGGRHSHSVGELLFSLARILNMEESEALMLSLAGNLHDIGKVAIPDTILQKQTSLTEEEWDTVRQHPIVGAHVVSNIPMLRPIAPIIQAHHERWDGTGYPDHLVGEQIPRGARILAVVNAYFAMQEIRPYHPKGFTSQQALAEIQRCAGTQFDPKVVAALVEVLAQTPEPKLS